MDLKSISAGSGIGSVEAKASLQNRASDQAQAVSDKLIESVEKTPEPGKGAKLNVEA